MGRALTVSAGHAKGEAPKEIRNLSIVGIGQYRTSPNCFATQLRVDRLSKIKPKKGEIFGTYTKNSLAFNLQFKVNWASCILSGNPNPVTGHSG